MSVVAVKENLRESEDVEVDILRLLLVSWQEYLGLFWYEKDIHSQGVRLRFVWILRIYYGN